MDATYFYICLIIGMFLSLLLDERLGITPGGMIVPGYLALVADQPLQIVLVFAVSFLVYWLVNHVLPHFVVLFGKRKYIATLFLTLVIKLALDVAFPYVNSALMPLAAVELRGVGAITPALLASSYGRQHIRYTIPATLILTYATFGLATLLFMVI